MMSRGGGENKIVAQAQAEIEAERKRAREELRQQQPG